MADASLPQAKPKLTPIEKARKLIRRYRRSVVRYDRANAAFERQEALDAIRGIKRVLPGGINISPAYDKALDERWAAEKALARFLVRESGVAIPTNRDDEEWFPPGVVLVDGLLWLAMFMDNDPIRLALHSIDLRGVPQLPADGPEWTADGSWFGFLAEEVDEAKAYDGGERLLVTIDVRGERAHKARDWAVGHLGFIDEHTNAEPEDAS